MFGSDSLEKVVKMLEEANQFLAEQGQEYVQQLVEYKITVLTYGLWAVSGIFIVSLLVTIFGGLSDREEVSVMSMIFGGLVTLISLVIGTALLVSLFKLNTAPTVFIIDHVLGG